MTEKYYIVSESELERLRRYAYAYGAGSSMHADYNYDYVCKAEAACRARPVEEFGTIGNNNTLWEEVKDEL